MPNLPQPQLRREASQALHAQANPVIVDMENWSGKLTTKEQKYFRNPTTQRLIVVGGRRHRELVRDGLLPQESLHSGHIAIEKTPEKTPEEQTTNPFYTQSESDEESSGSESEFSDSPGV